MAHSPSPSLGLGRGHQPPPAASASSGRGRSGPRQRLGQGQRARLAARRPRLGRTPPLASRYPTDPPRPSIVGAVPRTAVPACHRPRPPSPRSGNPKPRKRLCGQQEVGPSRIVRPSVMLPCGEPRPVSPPEIAGLLDAHNCRFQLPDGSKISSDGFSCSLTQAGRLRRGARRHSFGPHPLDAHRIERLPPSHGMPDRDAEEIAAQTRRAATPDTRARSAAHRRPPG